MSAEGGAAQPAGAPVTEAGILAAPTLPLGETPEGRRREALVKDAGQAALRRLSARSVAEDRHFDVELNADDERQERIRAEVGLPSLRAERIRHEQLLWVAAYLEFSLSHGLLKQYDQALAYYAELQQRARDAQDPDRIRQRGLRRPGAGPR